MYIDADAHLDEWEETWAHMPKELRPTDILLEPDQVPPWLPAPSLTRFWFMDGALRPRRMRDDAKSGTTTETRELKDVPARLRDMDELGIEIQVLYPSALLNEVTRRPELEVALCSSYNQWVAARCSESGGRLRWVAPLPFGSIPDALDEMKRVKDLGAVGIFKRGIEWDRTASDPYFFPIYAKAAELHLPVCVHSSLPWAALDPHYARVRPSYTQGFGGVTVLQAFFALVADRVPERFPGLRIGLIEAGSGWLPYMLDTVRFHGDRRQFLKDSNIFVGCEAGEDLAYIVDKIGPDSLLIGTDYTHSDRFSLMDAHRSVESRGDLDDGVAEKITSLNARTFYRLDEV